MYENVSDVLNKQNYLEAIAKMIDLFLEFYLFIIPLFITDFYFVPRDRHT